MTNLLSGPPKRQPSRQQLEDAHLGWCQIDNVNYKQIGNRTARCVARRGSKTARDADATGSHPTKRGFVICWKFLGPALKIITCLVVCPGTWLVALKMVAMRGQI